MPKIGLAVVLCAAVDGFCLAAQGGINATLRAHLAHPLHTTLISFAVGTLATIALCLVWTHSLPRPSASWMARGGRSPAD